LSRCYGFNKQYSGIGRELSLISQEMLEITDIDSIFSDFEKEYSSKLDQKFDTEYYLQDLEDGIFTEILQFKSEFHKLLLHLQKEEIVFNSKDLKEITKDIPRKEYIIQEKDEKSIYLGLVDLMFSFSYNYLLNCGEDNSESFWNLVKTSPTLSGFLIFSDLKQVLTTCAKASLSWPLLRNWEFINKVLKHTTIIFKLGKKGIVKALLEMKRILEGDERTFSICQIYIIDYLSWLMTSASDKTLASFASSLNHFTLEKCDIFFNEKSLVEIETIRN
jgi:protein SHQ1